MGCAAQMRHDLLCCDSRMQGLLSTDIEQRFARPVSGSQYSTFAMWFPLYPCTHALVAIGFTIAALPMLPAGLEFAYIPTDPVWKGSVCVYFRPPNFFASVLGHRPELRCCGRPSCGFQCVQPGHLNLHHCLRLCHSMCRLWRVMILANSCIIYILSNCGGF